MQAGDAFWQLQVRNLLDYVLQVRNLLDYILQLQVTTDYILHTDYVLQVNIPLSPSKFASYFGNFFPKFSIFFQNFQFFSKIFNFFPKFSIFFQNFQFFFQNFQKISKFSEVFKISKITIDFEYFPNIFRSIINNHTSWKFGWQWRSCYDHCLIEMPLNTRIQLNSKYTIYMYYT